METTKPEPKKPIDWVESLKNYISQKKQRLPEEIEKETDEIFLELMEESRKK
jgi:hypothetical protein